MKRPVQVLLLLLLILAVGLALARFFAENIEPLQLEFMGFRTKSASKGVVAIIIFFIGVLVSFVAAFSALVRRSIESARLRRENESLQRLLEEKAHSSSSKT